MTSDDLRKATANLMPRLTADLERLVRLPSVAFEGFPGEPVAAAGAAVAEILTAAGVPGVRLVNVPGSPPAVYGARDTAPGAPTVLLYAHYDVQPAGDESLWTSPPFEPTIRAGRLYGRGAADNKSGVIVHAGALLALGGDRRTGVKLLIEGQEECGEGGIMDFVRAHAGLLAADVVVIADGGNCSLGVPTLTTSLRGVAVVDLEIETLAGALHSGVFGGPAPDALIALTRMLATLHDEAGDVAVPGLTTITYYGAGTSEDEFRAGAAVLPGVDLIGSGTIADRLYAKASINVIGLDAPAVDGALNALVPKARARVSARLAPGQDPKQAQEALIRHLESVAPWHVRVRAAPAGAAEGFLARTGGPAYAAAADAMATAYGRDAVHHGQGGSIPLVAAFHAALPDAEVILWGAQEPGSKIHAPDESVDLGELERATLAEALFLAALGRQA